MLGSKSPGQRAIEHCFGLSRQFGLTPITPLLNPRTVMQIAMLLVDCAGERGQERDLQEKLTQPSEDCYRHGHDPKVYRVPVRRLGDKAKSR